MRGIRRLRSYLERTKLRFNAKNQLENWKPLLENGRRAQLGESVTGRPVLQFRNGLKITMVPCSYLGWDLLFREIFVDKCYQPTPDFIPQKGWNVIDLGANMGFFTCQTAFSTPGTRVISVEPLPLYAETLTGNIQDNRLTNAQVVQGAICGDPGLTIPIEVWYSKDGELKTGTPLPGARTETINARGYTLPEVYNIATFDRCDLLKVDIEGAEYPLFEKIPADLWKKIHRIVMEVHNDEKHNEKEIVEILKKNDFAIHLEPNGEGTSLLHAVARSARN
jgi:FkbM family methyltransferase